MKLSIQLFAAAKDAAGESPVLIDLPNDSRVADLRRELITSVPNLKTLAPSLLIAINNQYADDDTPLTTDQQIACFPPVSGG